MPLELGRGAHTCNISAREAEAGVALQAQSQPGLQRELVLGYSEIHGVIFSQNLLRPGCAESFSK